MWVGELRGRLQMLDVGRWSRDRGPTSIPRRGRGSCAVGSGSVVQSEPRRRMGARAPWRAATVGRRGRGNLIRGAGVRNQAAAAAEAQRLAGGARAPLLRWSSGVLPNTTYDTQRHQPRRIGGLRSLDEDGLASPTAPARWSEPRRATSQCPTVLEQPGGDEPALGSPEPSLRLADGCRTGWPGYRRNPGPRT